MDKTEANKTCNYLVSAESVTFYMAVLYAGVVEPTKQSDTPAVVSAHNQHARIMHDHASHRVPRNRTALGRPCTGSATPTPYSWAYVQRPASASLLHTV